jgi:hypothetical protein
MIRNHRDIDDVIAILSDDFKLFQLEKQDQEPI